MIKKRTFALIIAILCFYSPYSYATDNETNGDEQLNEVNKEIENTQNKIKQAQDKFDNINKKVIALESEMSALQMEIDIENQRLEQLDNELLIKQNELTQLQLEYNNNFSLYEKHLVNSYKSTFEQNYAKVLFNTETVSDFMLGNAYYKYLLKDKDSALTFLVDNIDEQNKLIIEIEENKKKSEESHKILNSKRQNLEKKQTTYQKEIEYLQNDVSDLSIVLESQNREAENITNQINKLQESLYDSNLSGTTSSSKTFSWPTKSKRITSQYGFRIHPISGQSKMHTGIDIGEGMGAGIYAANSGTVIYADWRGGYGKTIIIDHGNYISTLYAHLNDIRVVKGQQVSKGQQIGTMGSTGMSTGPHLHFEVRKNGQHQNPMNYIK